jgi:hypothetical protein
MYELSNNSLLHFINHAHTQTSVLNQSSLHCLVTASNGVASSASISSGFCTSWLQLPSRIKWRPTAKLTHKTNSKLYYNRRTGFQSVLMLSTIWGRTLHFYFSLTVVGLLMWGAHSDGGLVCPLQLLLTLASAVVLGSESSGTHEHIFLPLIRDSQNLECQFHLFISPRNRVAQLYTLKHWVPFSSLPTARSRCRGHE